MTHRSGRGRGIGTDDHRLAAALLASFNEDRASSLGQMALDEDTSKIASNVIRLSSARKRLQDTGMEDVLSFGGRPSGAAGFAPPPIDIDLTDTERANLFFGTDDGDVSDFIPKSKYKRLTSEWRDTKLGEAFDNPIVKKSVYAAAGLMAASFIYAAKKDKDRGEQEMSGPPLLPGGSAYEQMPVRTPQIPNTSMFSGYSSGMGHSVHIEGSRDQMSSFRESMGSVVNGPINSTMSRGLPQLGRDTYSQIASSF